ncbi:WD40-repeat-containing domain protein [Penicillium herquei]|nr:WD40-repeat-containing domain protein [Penicillium herquei]
MPRRHFNLFRRSREDDTVGVLPSSEPKPVISAQPPGKGEPTVPEPKNLWDAAFDMLSESDQQVLQSNQVSVLLSNQPSDSPPEVQDILNNVIEATKSRYEKYKFGAWKLKYSSGDIELRDSALKIVNAALAFKDVIGAAVAFDPTGHASTAWSIVSIGLTADDNDGNQVTKNHHDAHAAVFQSSEFLAEKLSRYGLIEVAYRHDKTIKSKEGVENAIIQVYFAILNYAAQLQIEQNAGTGTHILRSFTALADQPLTALKASISTQEENLKQWMQIDDNIRRKDEAENILSKIDQTFTAVENLNRALEFAKLKIAEGASFDSYANQYEQECLPETRTDPLRDIYQWADSPSSKGIFWLNGMAGTGKSTISRTVSQSFKETGCLGATFFFKKGEVDRQSAAKFFPTIVHQLIYREPRLVPYVQSAIQSDPDLATKSLMSQFESLLLYPLVQLNKEISVQDSELLSLVIIIDALDECQSQNDVRALLQLLPRLIMPSKEARLIKIFITSRPELPIRAGFTRISGEQHQDLMLHEVSEAALTHDISLFIRHKLKLVQSDNPSLPDDWPGDEIVTQLVKRSVPLFIFASTVCRFVADDAWDPEERLNQLLSTFKSGNSESSILLDVYRPVLDSLIAQRPARDQALIIAEFREIIGTIALLARPLPAQCLANMLQISIGTVNARIKSLHSVLHIPEDQDQPVRMLHLSFREFLLESEPDHENPFRIDGESIHSKLFTQCIRVMIDPATGLRRNICSLAHDGTLRSEVEPDLIGRSISKELSYACQFWPYHFRKAKHQLTDDHKAFGFLRTHLLFWLEAMGIMGSMDQVVRDIDSLQSTIDTASNDLVSPFLSDVKRFVLFNRSIIDLAPLQLYSAALTFAPTSSLVAKEFSNQIPSWFSHIQVADTEWGFLLQTLDTYKIAISIAFHPEGKLLACGASDGLIGIWDFTTGAPKQIFQAHKFPVLSITFSKTGLLASGADDVVKLWDPELELVLHTLLGHRNNINDVTFSPDGNVLATCSADRTIKLWNVSTGTLLSTLQGHSEEVNSISFSFDENLLASGSLDNTVNIWDISTGSGTRQIPTRKDIGGWKIFSFLFSYRRQSILRIKVSVQFQSDLGVKVKVDLDLETAFIDIFFALLSFLVQCTGDLGRYKITSSISKGLRINHIFESITSARIRAFGAPSAPPVFIFTKGSGDVAAPIDSRVSLWDFEKGGMLHKAK